ncbi:MAG: helix-turn-helix domain-containing protein [Candidatus Woesearchaeota archaeon]|nr:helix-turn-helix domain-containing protein [Candidatus Woesearchaeota archaeon]
MWTIKIIIPATEKMLIGSRTKKYNIDVMGFPLSSFSKNEKFYTTVSVYLVGEDSAKKAFLQDLKKDKRSIKIEMMNDNFGLWLTEQYPENKIFYDPLLIYIKPIIISKNGEYIFEIASWDREHLSKIAKAIKKEGYEGKLISIKQQKINELMITSVAPKLTVKQKRALELAIENGYYDYPRGIDVIQLAKRMGLAYSTYQFHLRKAEKKIIPFVYRISHSK